jgi:hypothetical protein
MSDGDETLARFFKGDVSMRFGDIELKSFGEGREDVGLICLIAEENCVWPNN